MAREANFKGTIGYSVQPVAGVTLYQDRKPSEPSIEEMLEELDRSDIRAARKQELLARIKERIASLEGTKKEEKAPENPKRYLVDPQSGRIDVVDDGEYTYKDALAVSASIKGKAGDYDGAINLINAAKTLAEGTKLQPEEKKKEFYIDDEGVIHHDPENGEFTLSEARAVSQSKRPQVGPPPSYFIDAQGNVNQLAPGQPAVIEKPGPPGSSFVVQPDGSVKQAPLGQPIIVTVDRRSEGSAPTPIQLTDKDGKPMVMDLTSLISWRRFEGEERRAEDDQKNKTDMMGTVKDFLTKLAAAAQRTASR